MTKRPATPAAERAQLVRVLKALAHAQRFRMVEELAAAGELSCGQLAEKFDLSQPTVSHHLKILIDAGLLIARHHGPHHFLSVDGALLAELAALLPARLAPPPPKSPRKRSRP
jgi:DNA-binding transcriptional ArsR family regulator